jgi:hypothetical protein
MSLVVDVEIESTDTVVKRCTQALIDCGATGCFIDIEWAKLNNVPTRPLTKTILVIYNVDGTANDAGAITDIADVILRYENHSERIQLAVTRLGKQSLILGYNWLCNHNPEINWQTKDVNMSHCPLQCSTCRAEDKRDAKIQKSMTSQINACRLGAFPRMVEEDEDESPHMDTDETDEEAQDTGPAFDDNLDSDIVNIIIEEDDRVFSETAFESLPEHRKWDHAIELECEPSPGFRKVYPMTLTEQMEMDAFLEEALATGRIRQSKSPLRAPVFFIKKKDKKLRFVQDYRALNATTRKNQYLLPLINDLIHRLKGTHYFTKLDVRWVQ